MGLVTGTLTEDYGPLNNFKCHKCKCHSSEGNSKSIHSFNVDTSPSSVSDEAILTEISSLTPSPKDQEEVSKLTIPANVIFKGYSEICSCRGLNCQCTAENFTYWQKCLPRNATYWPKTKLAGLIIAGSLPWIFLLIYLVLHYGTY